MLHQPTLSPFVCHPTEKPRRVVPLIEYGAKGRYVLIAPEEGEVPIMPDTPEWFASRMKSESAKWAKIVRASGATAD